MNIETKKLIYLTNKPKLVIQCQIYSQYYEQELKDY